jgi:hypothetical protein
VHVHERRIRLIAGRRVRCAPFEGRVLFEQKDILATTGERKSTVRKRTFRETCEWTDQLMHAPFCLHEHPVEGSPVRRSKGKGCVSDQRH